MTDWWRSERSRNGGADEIPLPGAGRLWLCGKHFVGPDPDEALRRTSTSAVVCLSEAYELSPRYPSYVHWLEANAGDRAVWHPIPDLHVPGPDELDRLLVALRQRLDAEDGLLVHCGAGMGRAGTIATALLIKMGVSGDAALRTVRESRPGAGPQTAEQAQLLAELDGPTSGPAPAS
jgi:protein-tyrosine phosphatase